MEDQEKRPMMNGVEIFNAIDLLKASQGVEDRRIRAAKIKAQNAKSVMKGSSGGGKIWHETPEHRACSYPGRLVVRTQGQH